MVKNPNWIEKCEHCGLFLDNDRIHYLFAAKGFCCSECLIAEKAKLKPLTLVRPMLQFFGRELGDFLNFDSESYEEVLSQAVYKATQCGAFLKINNQYAIQLGSLVDECDLSTETYTLVWPFSPTEFWETLDEIEGEAAYIWDQTHGCECCHTEGEWGHEAIDPLCKNCKGQGGLFKL